MAKDPFVVLGVSRDADEDTIKKAYRQLARENHPDRFTDPEESARASERMKEINAAYEEIQKIRSGRSTYGNTRYEEKSSSGDERYAHVRRYINAGRIREADAVLASIPEAERNAEWHFLRGCVLLRHGNYIDAGRCFDIACTLDPENVEYRRARERLRQRTSSYSGGSFNTDSSCSCGDGCCDCMKLLCCFTICSGGPGPCC